MSTRQATAEERQTGRDQGRGLDAEDGRTERRNGNFGAPEEITLARTPAAFGPDEQAAAAGLAEERSRGHAAGIEDRELRTRRARARDRFAQSVFENELRHERSSGLLHGGDRDPPQTGELRALHRARFALGWHEADRRDADLAALVRSAAEPGLQQRIAHYRARLLAAQPGR